jgi:hypothetical protein
MSIIILQLIFLSLYVLIHTMVATKHDLNIMSMNMNVNQAKSFSIDFSSTGYSMESTFDEDTISPSSIPVEFMDMASYSFQFSSNFNAKDEDSSRGNIVTTTYSLDFSSQATEVSSSLSYLRRE